MAIDSVTSFHDEHAKSSLDITTKSLTSMKIITWEKLQRKQHSESSPFPCEEIVYFHSNSQGSDPMGHRKPTVVPESFSLVILTIAVIYEHNS